MGYTLTPINGWSVPDHNEKLADIWKALPALAKGAETYVNMRFASMSDLTTKLTGDYAPTAGMVAYIRDVKQWIGFDGTAWRRIYPVERQIFVGTTNPAASLGAVGDVYLQY